MEERKVIAVCVLSNVGGLAMYEISDETVLVGYNDEKPRSYKVYETNKGYYFNWGKRRMYFSEFMRVGV